MKKIRVIELIDRITDAGAESIVRDYVTHIDKSRFEICIVTNSQNSINSANVRRIIESNIDIASPFLLKNDSIFCKFYSKAIKAITSLFPRLCDKLYIAPFIKRRILHFKPDVIHVHLNTLPYLMPISSRLHSSGVKLFYTCHSLPERYFNNNDHKRQLEAAEYLIEHNGLQIIALHDEMRCELNRMFNINNAVVLHNCIDYNRFQSCPETKSEIRASLGIPENAFVIGHVGRFVYIKNQVFLSEVFKCVFQREENAFLLMIGDGSTDEVENKLKSYGLDKHYLILGHRSDMPRMYKAMDIFAFPSLFEGLPCACVEAQAAGLRCIISSNVTKDVLFDRRAVDADISSPQHWAEIILDESIEGRYNNDITEFDISKGMSILERLYSE